MSGCEMYQELISCLLDGELNEEESTALAEHLEHCPECEAMFEAFAGLSRSLGENMEEVPEGLHENIMAAVRREDIKNKNSRKKLSKPMKAALTTAACAVLVVGVGAAVLPGLFRSKSAAPENYAMVASDRAAMPAEAYDEAEPPKAVPEAGEESRMLPEQETAQFSLKNSLPPQQDKLTQTDAGAGQDSAQVLVLEEENWIKLEKFMEENSASAEISLPEAPDWVISLSDESQWLNVYFVDDLLYCLRADGQVFSVACNREDFAALLDNLQ